MSEEVQRAEQPVFNAGEVFEATVSKITLGVIREFVKAERLSKWHNPDQQAYDVTLVFPDGSTSTKLFPRSASPASNLGLFLKMYGKLETGMKVKVMRNANGYLDIIYK